MSELILHHFDWSPYAEKVRVLLGIKGLAWRSVQIPMVMPKPDLTALTGGYRKTPVLQVGADIYCDTSLIARELERRLPRAARFFRAVGVASHWPWRPGPNRFFDAGPGLAMGLNDQLPADLVKDRQEFFSHMDFGSFRTRAPHAVRAGARARGPGRGAIGRRARLPHGQTPGTRRRHRVLRVVDGARLRRSDERTAEPYAADRRAGKSGCVRSDTASAPRSTPPTSACDRTLIDGRCRPAGSRTATRWALKAGQRVTVTPDDYGKVPVAGELVTLQLQEVAVRRVDERAGEVVVHFPRIGYVVEACMIDLHFYPSPNGLKISMMLEECGCRTASSR